MNQNAVTTPGTFTFYIPASGGRGVTPRHHGPGGGAGSFDLPVTEDVMAALPALALPLLAQWSLVTSTGARLLRDPGNPSTFSATLLADADTTPAGLARALSVRLRALLAV